MAMLSSGSDVIDELLNGGFETGIITTIYGPSGTGKTNICLISALSAAEKSKVIYIDTEGGISHDRLRQLSKGNRKRIENILFLKPTTFQEQLVVFNKLRKLVTKKLGLIVVDTISMLYRAELSNVREVYEINKELGKQLSYLVEIARKLDIAILIADQVYSDFNNRNNVKLVGGDIITYSSKCLIELKSGEKGERYATLVKHRSLPRRTVCFKITEKGLKKHKPSFGLI